MAYADKEKQDIIDKVCHEIAENKLSVRKALEKIGEPNRDTFYKWLSSNKSFSDQYARATELRAESIFEEMITIADNQENDVLKNEDGAEFVNHNVIQRSRLRIDTRKWILSKMIPKKYGDKVDVTSGGEKINHNEPVELIVKDYSKK